MKDEHSGGPFDRDEVHQRADGWRGQFTVADAFEKLGG